MKTKAPTYKVLEKHGDFKKAVIRRQEMSHVDFTFEDIEKTQNDYSKNKREIEAQLKVNKANLENIARNHGAFLDTLDDMQKHTIWLYMETKAEVEAEQTQVDGLTEALSRYVDMKEEILRQVGEDLGFKKSDA